MTPALHFLVECISCDQQFRVKKPVSIVPPHAHAEDDRPIPVLKCVGSGKNGRYVGPAE